MDTFKITFRFIEISQTQIDVDALACGGAAFSLVQALRSTSSGLHYLVMYGLPIVLYAQIFLFRLLDIVRWSFRG